MKLFWLEIAAFATALVGAGAANRVTVWPGQVNGHPYLRWDLDAGADPYPASVCVEFIEVAKYPAIGSDGYFFLENVVDYGSHPEYFNGCARQGEWVSSFRLPAYGTYYLRVMFERKTDFATWWIPPAAYRITWEKPPPPPPQVTNWNTMARATKIAKKIVSRVTKLAGFRARLAWWSGGR